MITISTNTKNIIIVAHLIRQKYNDYENLEISESEGILTIKVSDKQIDRYKYYEDWEVDELVDAYNEQQLNDFISSIDDYEIEDYINWKKWHAKNDAEDMLDIDPDLEYVCGIDLCDGREHWQIYKCK